MNYATDSKCHNAQPGTFGHECGKPAQWVGEKPTGFKSGFCSDCKEHGHEARECTSWVPYTGEKVEKLEWAPLWAAMAATPEVWIHTTEDMYWQMLEVVPPRAQARGRFLVGEAERHNEQGQAVYACFKESGTDYFARYMTLEQFKMGAAA